MHESDALPYRIAVIDDDFSTLRLLEWTLARSWGYSVSMYSSASACFSEIPKPPDVVLIAVGAEQRDIVSVTSSLHRAWPDVVVILLTVHGEHGSAAQALGAGAWDYFDKPLDLHRMKHVLSQALEHRGLKIQLRKRQRRRNAKQEALPTMDQVKSRAVIAALKQSGGNVKEAARLLGIGRTTMYKLMSRYRIDHHVLDPETGL